jgi:hypothetical protein
MYTYTIDFWLFFGFYHYSELFSPIFEDALAAETTKVGALTLGGQSLVGADPWLF